LGEIVTHPGSSFAKASFDKLTEFFLPASERQVRISFLRRMPPPSLPTARLAPFLRRRLFFQRTVPHRRPKNSFFLWKFFFYLPIPICLSATGARIANFFLIYTSLFNDLLLTEFAASSNPPTARSSRFSKAETLPPLFFFSLFFGSSFLGEEPLIFPSSHCIRRHGLQECGHFFEAQRRRSVFSRPPTFQV